MHWSLSYRADSHALHLVNEHYSRQSPDSPQFMPPGACVVLLAPKAVWGISLPKPEYVKHAWPGAWINSLFRNEGEGLSSQLILEAVAATRAILGTPPPLGMVTFVDASKVRRKRDPGRCYLRAGFHRADPPTTKGGLLAFQLLPHEMPAPEAPMGFTSDLFARTP